MTSAAAWIQQPIAQGLGWALVHFVWQGALIGIALASVLPWIIKPRIRYALGCTALAAMPAIFAITWTQAIPEPALRVAASTEPAAVARTPAGPPAAFGTAALLERIHAALPWLVALWGAGALLVGAYRAGGWLTVQRMRRVGVCAPPSEWRERVRSLARLVGIKQSVTLLESSLAEAPMVIGVLRPVILFPAGLLSGLPASQVEAVLLHELAHIRRLDYLVNVLQTAVESVLFYHPAVWWVSAAVRSERENCCDDAVVELEGDARVYAAALMRLEEMRCIGREPAAAATGGNLMNRIRRLLRASDEPRSAAGPALSICLLLGVFCTLALAQQGTDVGSGKAYAKWLEQDVVYIIADEERKAFEQLGTDAERDRFVEQFWDRRDPNPATRENEFKQEHYRRIAYANERFEAAGIAGWASDRGRFYIAYGPPDMIEAHPSGGTIAYEGSSRPPVSIQHPFQVWRYREVDGVGTDLWFDFVDVNRNGSYRLALGPTTIGP